MMSNTIFISVYYAIDEIDNPNSNNNNNSNSLNNNGNTTNADNSIVPDIPDADNRLQTRDKQQQQQLIAKPLASRPAPPFLHHTLSHPHLHSLLAHCRNPYIGTGMLQTVIIERYSHHYCNFLSHILIIIVHIFILISSVFSFI